MEMTRTNAFGAVVAIAVARSRTMPALIWKADGKMRRVMVNIARWIHLEEIISVTQEDRSDRATQTRATGPLALSSDQEISAQFHAILTNVLTPGLRGTPAGMTMMSAPVRTVFRPSFGGSPPAVLAGVEMCERSTATPGAFTISNRPS